MVYAQIRVRPALAMKHRLFAMFHVRHTLLIVRRVLCVVAMLYVYNSFAFAQQAFVSSAFGVKLNPQQSEIFSEIRSLPTTQTAIVVRLNADALRDGEPIWIPLEAKSVVIQNNSRKSTDGSMTWFGAAPNETAGSTTIIANKQTVTGSIRTADGFYQIRPLGDGLHALVKVDSNRLPPEHPPAK
jgi:hypothetical protein